MQLDHRLVYKADVGLFLLLAVPGLNAIVLDVLLSTGTTSLAKAGTQQSLVYTLCGIAGVLGLGLALLRLRLADSRHTVFTSMLIKVAAAGWLLYAFYHQVADAFLLLALADLSAAALFFKQLYKP